MRCSADSGFPSLLAHLALLSILLSLTACASTKPSAPPAAAIEERPQGASVAVASWYGREFHGRPTSSGETFNMNALTCAHKTYPFGTRVRVTNLANQKTVECVVNDRGPFVEGRDIDLSYASAKEIGMIGTGTARVELLLNGRDESYIRTVKVQSTGKAGPFAIQVGSFSESVNAVRLKVALRLAHANVYIQEAEVKGETFYRVRIGNYDSMSQALSIAEKLGQEGYPAVVLRAEVRL